MAYVNSQRNPVSKRKNSTTQIDASPPPTPIVCIFGSAERM